MSKGCCNTVMENRIFGNGNGSINHAKLPTGEEVVITGMAGKFPDSENVYHFRDNLFNKVDMVSGDFRRWKPDHPEIPQRTGKLFNIQKFDSGFFGVSNLQTNNMDPMIRMVLEKAFEAVIDAGHHPSDFENTNTAVCTGASFSETEKFVFYEGERSFTDAITNTQRSMISKRISYSLKLKGPALVADTACSSSLSAMEQAYVAIKQGLCEKAIVCGTQLCLHPIVSLQFARLGVLSPDGKCKSFDANGNGYVRSEGIVVLILEKAKDANRIYSEIVHAKTNCDGYKGEGITHPSSDAQKMLMRDFYAECMINPTTLSFVEAHGTGTKVGDPEELSTIDEIFCKGKNEPLYIGAIKSNIGHNEPVCGLCSVVKVLVGMETGFIPPNLNYKKPRGGVEGLEKGRMVVVTDKMSLPNQRGLYGINSFGFGGGNAHVLLRWNPKAKINAGKPIDDLPRSICVSSRVMDGVNAVLDDFRSRESDAEYAYLIQHAFRKSIDNHDYRGYGIYDSHGEIKRSLTEMQTNKPNLYVIFSNFDKEWSKVGKLFTRIPIFENATKSIQNILRQAMDSKVSDIISNSGESILMEILGFVAIQISLANLLREIELTPYRIIGVGTGEFVAAYLDNYLTLKQTVLGLFYVALNLNKERIKKWDNLKTIFPSENKPCAKWLPNDEGKLRTNPANYFANTIISSNTYLGRKLVPDDALSLVIGADIKDMESGKIIRLIDANSKNIVDFLSNLGSLFECGFHMRLENLYPPVNLPVSRSTPMLSPLIKWYHAANHYVSLHENKVEVKRGHRVLHIVPKSEEWSFVLGHVIDGRNLFPATGYLVLVWESFAIMMGKLLSEMTIVFEDVKYIRAANIPKDGSLNLLLMIHNGTHMFEVIRHFTVIVVFFLLEGGATIVTGKVFVKTHQYMPSIIPRLRYDENGLWLSEKDVYQELKLRGYQYSGKFRSIRKCTEDGSYAIIEWNGNWISFMDCLLQLALIKEDTRSLYVPTSIGQVIIDGPKHLTALHDKTGMVSVYLDKGSGTIRTGSIEVKGLGCSAIPKRKAGDPVLEISKFVPNVTSLNAQDAVRSLVQLMLENSNTLKAKVVELLPEDGDESDLLYPIIQKSLDDTPLMQQDITVLSERPLDLSKVTVENKLLDTHTHCLIVVISNMLETVEISAALNAIKGVNGFIVSREHHGVDLIKFSKVPLTILASYICEKETLVMLSPKFEIPDDKHYIDLTNAGDKIDIWLPLLQDLLKERENITLYAQNEELSGILGLVTCLRREQYDKNISCLLIIDDAPKFNPKLEFYKEQLDKNLGINIWKDGSWGTYRHLLLPTTQLVENEHCYVNTTTKGDLSTLTWLEGRSTREDTLSVEEDFVHIYYAALNFRDLMTASGKIQPDVITGNRIQQECVQGFEFVGRNSKGERVMGMCVSGALATLTRCEMMQPIPDEWTMEDAATTFVTYGTVMEVFLRRYEPKRGQTILIHSGTGGVGLAAINLSLYFGLTVFVTVGTQEKRDFIRQHFPQIKNECILNSRDTSFEDMIHQQTRGRGVDIVLNSLAEEKLVGSLRCLAKGGKFFEIGKFDLANNSTLTLELLENEAEFIGVALDRYIIGNYLSSGTYKEQLVRLMSSGAIKPLPRTVFRSDEVERAFRYMGIGKHIGKVLIKIRDEEKEKVYPVPRRLFKAVPRIYCKPECSYLLCGGLGGFGLELADFLVVRGAKKLILTSRSGSYNGYQRYRIRIWKTYGVRVITSTQDASTEEGCEQLLTLANDLAPVDGIFNLAAVLKDALFENHSVEDFQVPLIPKAHCTKNLDSISRKLCPNLRYFVIFSSVSCGRGNTGQTNYGMANSIMERICEKRKREGYPALAIQWGAIGEVGLVAKMQEDHKELVIGGTLQQRVSSCLEVLDKFLKQDEPVVASMLVAEKEHGSGSSNLFDAILDIIGITNLKSVSVHATFPELGMDSMMAIEVKQTLEREYQMFLTAQDIKGMTLSKLKDLASGGKSVAKVGTPVVQSELPVDIKLLLTYIGREEFANIPVRNLRTLVEDSEVAPHIIVLPGIEGMAAILEPLCEKLKAHVSCLQHSNDVGAETLAELAERLLPHFETTTGDVTILGYSYGCVVATEVLYMLEAKGRTANVIFIDGSPELLCNMAKTYFPADNENLSQILLLSVLMTRYMPYQEIIKHQERLKQFKTYMERIEYFLSVSPTSDISTTFITEMCVSGYNRIKSLMTYNIRKEKLKSNLTLFKAKSAPALKAIPDYGLSGICENPVDVISIEGDHVTMLKNDDLARGINKILKNK